MSSSDWYVIGHRNPDADAICAAIGHAAYLNATGEVGVRAARCGELPPRVAVVLKKAGLQAPDLVDDVRPTAGSICRDEVVSVCEDDTFLCAYRLMVENEVRAVPVLNEEGERAAALFGFVAVVAATFDGWAWSEKVVG